MQPSFRNGDYRVAQVRSSATFSLATAPGPLLTVEVCHEEHRGAAQKGKGSHERTKRQARVT
jgi:hypothetical protein